MNPEIEKKVSPEHARRISRLQENMNEEQQELFERTIIAALEAKEDPENKLKNFQDLKKKIEMTINIAPLGNSTKPACEIVTELYEGKESYHDVMLVMDSVNIPLPPEEEIEEEIPTTKVDISDENLRESIISTMQEIGLLGKMEEMLRTSGYSLQQVSSLFIERAKTRAIYERNEESRLPTSSSSSGSAVALQERTNIHSNIPK